MCGIPETVLTIFQWCQARSPPLLNLGPVMKDDVLNYIANKVTLYVSARNNGLLVTNMSAWSQAYLIVIIQGQEGA